MILQTVDKNRRKEDTKIQTLTLKIYMSGMGPIETMAISDMMNSFNLKMHDDSDSDSDDRDENSDVSRDDGLEIGGERSVICLSQDEKGDLNLTWKLPYDNDGIELVS